MEGDVTIERDVEIDEGLPEACDGVTAHGEQNEGVTEGHAGRRAARETHADRGEATKPHVLLIPRVVCGK